MVKKYFINIKLIFYLKNKTNFYQQLRLKKLQMSPVT
jgi:hypothetical protein